MHDVRIASAAEVGGAARLESAWLRAFGAGDRAAGWFRRKLVREHVDDDLSQVAIAIGSDPASPRSWRGFVLAGRLPSLGGAVRTAGTAVMPDMRGRGIGSALLRGLVHAAARAGADRVQIMADASTILYYERAGFRRVRDVVTIRLDACGEPKVLPHPVAWEAACEGIPDAVELAAWTPEAWAGSSRRTAIDLRGHRGRVLASREGAAWLVHRWITAESQRHTALEDVVLALQDALPGPAPVLVPHLDPALADEVSSITAVHVAQRGALLDASLSADVPVALQRKDARR